MQNAGIDATSIAGLRQSTWTVALDDKTSTAGVVLSFTPLAAHLGPRSIAYAKQHVGRLCTDTGKDEFKMVLARGDEETRKTQNECVRAILPQNTMRALALAGCV